MSKKPTGPIWMNVKCPVCGADAGSACRDLTAVPFSGSREVRQDEIAKVRSLAEPHASRAAKANTPIGALK